MSPGAFPAIEARDLMIGYPQAGGAISPVLGGLNLVVQKGEFLTILGPSGCGKSSLLRVVADLLAPGGGSISVLGQTPSRTRHRREVAFVFQDATLLPWRTVRQNIELPLHVGRRNLVRPIQGTASDMLALVGLADLADRFPHQLSGGQRQRVSIARALLCAPEILLMDEPFGAVDEITRDRLNDELLAIWQRTRTTILFVTHSIMEAIYLGERVLVLAANPGRVQAIVDLASDRMKSPGFARDSVRAVEVSAKLRQLLRTGNDHA